MGKELLFDVLRHKTVARPAWIPFAGVHSGKLVGYSARELLQDENKLFKSLIAVNKLYRPDGQPIIFDLQVEAEILGCDLEWYEDTPPTVISHILEQNKIVPCKCKMPTKDSGRLPMILSVMQSMKHAVGDTTALYGLVCGPFTLASHLRGTDIFLDMFDDANYACDLINFCKDFILEEAKLYIDAGMDVIAVVDPLISQISSEHFEEFCSKSYTEIFDYLRSVDVFSSFFVCGDATRNIESMCKTSPDSISVDENVNLAEIRDITEKYNVAVGGNIPLTTKMLHGTQQDNMKYTIELQDSIPNKNHNFIVAPGCDMPYDVPTENTIGVAQAVLEYDKVKDMVKDYSATDFSKYNIKIPDYKNLNYVLLEVFTLDSSSCAACTYMKNAALDAKAKYGKKIEVVEYKFTIKENIARCIKVGVKNLPSLYINGDLKYSSIIPSIDELSAEIDKYIK